jgi:hypothetical protein
LGIDLDDYGQKSQEFFGSSFFLILRQILGFEAGRIENSLLHNFGISFNKNIIKQRRGCCGNSDLN